MIVTVCGIKGGSGKTTLATNLAIMRARDSNDVLLVDSDTQNSALDFVKVRELEGHCPDLTCISLLGTSAGDELRKLKSKFDDIVVDVGGRDSATLRSVMLVTDLIVIPLLVSQYDLWALEYMDNLVAQVKEMNETVRSIVVVNKLDTNPKVDMCSELSELARKFEHITFSSICIGYRIAFRRSVADGVSVVELKGKKDLKSIKEITDLYKEVFKDA